MKKLIAVVFVFALTFGGWVTASYAVSGVSVAGALFGLKVLSDANKAKGTEKPVTGKKAEKKAETKSEKKVAPKAAPKTAPKPAPKKAAPKTGK
jgi:hypothetical protein